MEKGRKSRRRIYACVATAKTERDGKDMSEGYDTTRMQQGWVNADVQDRRARKTSDSIRQSQDNARWGEMEMQKVITILVNHGRKTVGSGVDHSIGCHLQVQT